MPEHIVFSEGASPVEVHPRVASVISHYNRQPAEFLTRTYFAREAAHPYILTLPNESNEQVYDSDAFYALSYRELDRATASDATPQSGAMVIKVPGFGNGVRATGQWHNAAVTADLTGMPTCTLALPDRNWTTDVLPNTAAWWRMDQDERFDEAVRIQRDFVDRSVGETVLGLTEDVGTVYLDGVSMGAAVAPALASFLQENGCNVGGVSLAAPPNVLERPQLYRQMLRDFGTSTGEFELDIRSGDPEFESLVVASGFAEERGRHDDMKDIVSYIATDCAGVQSPGRRAFRANRELTRGASMPTLAYWLNELPQDINIQITTYENDRVSPPGAVDSRLTELKGGHAVAHRRIEGDHGASSNPYEIGARALELVDSY